MSILLCFVCWIGIIYGGLDTKINLGGNDWMLSNGSMTAIPAIIPGQIYLPLMKANIISEPYYDLNVMLDRWIPQTNWNYTKTFNIDSSSGFLDNDIIQLICDGIDTKANIYINDKLIFMNVNMFHKSIINVKSYIKYGDNTILIEFFNKVDYANDMKNSCNVGADGQCPGCAGFGLPCVNYIRTEPCSFGWDWGPAFGPMGVWKPIYLQGYNTGVVRDMLIYANPVNNSNKPMEMDKDKTSQMSHDEYLIYKAYFNKNANTVDYTKWDTKVVVFVDTGANNVFQPANEYDNIIRNDVTISGTVVVTIEGLNQVFKQNVTITQGTEVNVTVNLGVLTGINIWMPNKFGKQTLYQFKANFVVNGVSDEGITKEYGFRKIEVIQDPLPSGRSFYFRINGINIPIHGSNWIPTYALDNSNQSVNTETLEPLFIALYESNQNMIRNWGGGIYQKKQFYELANKYGILIWEDFMFACAAYWDNGEFLESVKKESVDFLRETQTHPSIAIWAANNENGADCHANTESETEYRDLYWKSILDYVSIYDPTRPKVSSSPSNGNETEAEPCPFNGNTQDPYYGDVHQYLYNQDCWNTKIYVRARFVSEFGWQSWPSYSTMTQYLSEDQRYYNSPVMQNRQHHPNGQQQMINEINLHYGLPNEYYNTTRANDEGYRYILYATQYSQAYCYKTEVEFFRSLRNTCGTNNPGCTMGQMYWQTNDIWPGASWSGIDWTNRYKMVQYFSKKFYAKILVSGYYNGTHYTFWGINDYINEYNCISNNHCILELNSYSYTSGLLKTWTVNIDIDYQSATQVYSLSQNDFQTTSSCDLDNDCLLIWNLKDNNGTIINTNYIFISDPKNTNAKDPKLTITDVTKDNNGNFDISYTVNAISPFVWMETNITGNFNDNGMLLLPGNYKNTFYTKSNINPDQLKNSLYLYSLYDAGGFKNSPQYTS